MLATTIERSVLTLNPLTKKGGSYKRGTTAVQLLGANAPCPMCPHAEPPTRENKKHDDVIDRRSPKPLASHKSTKRGVEKNR